MLVQSDPKAAKELLQLAQEDVTNRLQMYQHLATLPVVVGGGVSGNGNGKETKS
jgi:hypothetical protein